MKNMGSLVGQKGMIGSRCEEGQNVCEWKELGYELVIFILVLPIKFSPTAQAASCGVNECLGSAIPINCGFNGSLFSGTALT